MDMQLITSYNGVKNTFVYNVGPVVARADKEVRGWILCNININKLQDTIIKYLK